MRIISKFKDYYDSSMGYGIDKSVIYNRKIKETKERNNELAHALTSCFTIIYKKDEYVVSSGIIFFCGKGYPFLRFEIVTYNSNKKDIHVFYSKEEYLSFLKKENKEKLALNLDKKRKYIWTLKEVDVFDILNKYVENHRSHKNDIHFKFNSPIILYQGFENGAIKRVKVSHNDDYYVTLNPNLSDYCFYKKVDSFQAFQEIDMYLSGVLGMPLPNTVEISDKDMAIKKGHGGKYSFKKPPEIKKNL